MKTRPTRRIRRQVIDADVVALAPPKHTVMFYLLIKRSTRALFTASNVFVGETLEDAQQTVVATLFGTGLPSTAEELFERYNLELVELDDEWQEKYDAFGSESPECLDPSSVVTKSD